MTPVLLGVRVRVVGVRVRVGLGAHVTPVPQRQGGHDVGTAYGCCVHGCMVCVVRTVCMLCMLCVVLLSLVCMVLLA